jgi:hypothetical protein
MLAEVVVKRGSPTCSGTVKHRKRARTEPTLVDTSNENRWPPLTHVP